MKKNSFIFILVGCVLIGAIAPLNAIPTPITGTLSFSGTATTDTGNFLTATRFVRFEEVLVGAASSLFGDYVGTAGAAVTIAPFIWNPPNASTPIVPLWTFASGGNTYSFDLSVLHSDFASPTGLLLSGLGTAYISGPGLDKLPTTGLWNLSAQNLGVSTFTFSSTSQTPASVAEGGSTAVLLGLALCAFGLLKRKLAL